MTRKEIERRIVKEIRRIERLKDEKIDIDFDIRNTRNAVRFWKSELKKCKED